MKKKFLTILMFLFLLPNLYAKNLIKNLEATGKHNTFISILENNPLFLSIINNSVKSSIFAPTDEAFAKLPKGTLESLLKPENKKQLVSILTYHVVPGKVMAKDVKSGMVKTASGSSFKMKVSKKGVYVNKAKVVATDVMADNGVIHVIDTVIIPKSK